MTLPEDAVLSLAEYLRPKEALLWATLTRNPQIPDVITSFNEFWKAIIGKVNLAPISVSLIGKAFTEEEAQLTLSYMERFLRLLA